MLLDRAARARRGGLSRHRRPLVAASPRDAPDADRGAARRPRSRRERSSRTRASSGGCSTLAAWQRSQVATRRRCGRRSTTSSARILPRQRSVLAGAGSVRVPAGARPARRVRDPLAARSKAKHLAAAAYLASSAGIDPDEIAEVVAAHYLDAFRADEDAHDAADIRSSARGWLERAAERATSPAAAEEAQRAFEAAAEPRRRPVGARTFDRARGEHGAHGEPHDRRRAAPHACARSVYGGGATRTDRPDRGRHRTRARFLRPHRGRDQARRRSL